MVLASNHGLGLVSCFRFWAGFRLVLVGVSTTLCQQTWDIYNSCRLRGGKESNYFMAIRKVKLCHTMSEIFCILWFQVLASRSRIVNFRLCKRNPSTVECSSVAESESKVFTGSRSQSRSQKRIFPESEPQSKNICSTFDSQRCTKIWLKCNLRPVLTQL